MIEFLFNNQITRNPRINIQDHWGGVERVGMQKKEEKLF